MIILRLNALFAKIKNGKAQRCEFYLQGVEISNGFHEELDRNRNFERFDTLERKRSFEPRSVQIEDSYLKAAQAIDTNIFGIAVGFDRLFALKENRDLAELYPYSNSLLIKPAFVKLEH